MAAVLLAGSTCFDALLLAPLQRALDAAGITHALTVFDDAAEAAALGVRVDRPCARPFPQADRAGHADALLREPWRCIATAGSFLDECLAVPAMAAGVPVVRLEAGVRTHPDGTAGARARRAADRAASAWCVPGDWERRALLREGMPGAAVHATGSLLAQALDAPGLDPTPAADPEAFVWLALEHQPSGRPDELRALLAGLAACGAPGRPGSPGVHAAVASHGVPLPANVQAAPAAAREQLARALCARAIVTDSVGYQRLAVAAGIPCVVVAGAELWSAGVGAGLVGATDAANPLGDALARALAHQRRPRPPATDAARAVVAVLDAAAGRAAPAAVVLPADGEASGRTLGEDEVALVAEVVRRGTLNSTRGTMVTAFEQRFAQWLGTRHAIACASGSAAMHCAIAALRLSPGDEVVTTPITDMGALTPILYEGAVPVFADVDPATLNVTAATVAAALTPRTRAIVATHLFGRPCELDGIRELARARDLPLVEDAAQAFGATWRGAKAGTFGALAAFSLQQGKHITTGEGGLVATDDDELARRVFLFVNKAWGYGDPQPDHCFPALNYRLTELQGAVALAQLPKLDGVVTARRAVAAALREQLADVPGLELPADPAHGTHAWWKFAFHVDEHVVPGGAVALGRRMQQAGVACVPRYIQKPAFECELFRDWARSPVTWLPLQHNPRRERAATMFDRRDFPGTVRALATVIVLPVNERYTRDHVEHVARTIRAAAAELQHA